MNVDVATVETIVLETAVGSDQKAADYHAQA